MSIFGHRLAFLLLFKFALRLPFTCAVGAIDCSIASSPDLDENAGPSTWPKTADLMLWSVGYLAHGKEAIPERREQVCATMNNAYMYLSIKKR